MQALKDEYSNLRENYSGLPISDSNTFDNELFSKFIADLAIAVRRIAESFVRNGSANLCSLDLSKAFDKVNLHAVFIKLMKSNIPVHNLRLVENALFICHGCVKWENIQSAFLGDRS